MDDHTLWHNLYGSRFDWCKQGRDEFIHSLKSPRSKRFYSLLGEDYGANIVFIGQPQVEKTLLMLNLIGIKETKLKELCSVLHSKQNEEQLISPTATVYSLAEGKFFTLKESCGETNSLTAEALCLKLSEVRNEIDAGEFNGDSFTEIGIPQEYFEHVSSGSQYLRIIDLPDLVEADPNEVAHARELAERFIPFANLVFLVVTATNLLHLEADDLPGVYGWKEHPEKFNVILSHSVSSQNIQEQLSDGVNDLAGFIDLFLKQIPDLPDSFSQNIFPLEVGHSREEKEFGHEDIYNKLNNYFEALYARLRKLIQAAHKQENTPNKTFLNSAHYFSELMNSTQDAVDQNMDFLRIELKQLQQEREKSLNQFEILKNEFESEQEKGTAAEEILPFEFQTPFESITESDDLLVDTLKSNLSEFEDLFETEFCAELEEFFTTIDYLKLDPVDLMGQAKKTLSTELNAIRSKLNSYWVGSYTSAGRFQEDAKELGRCIKQALNAVEKVIQKAVTKKCSKFCRRQSINIESRRSEVLRLGLSINKMGEKLAEFKGFIPKYESESQQMTKRLQRGFEDAENIRLHLDNAFDKELENSKIQLKNPKLSPEVRFLYLSHFSLLNEEYSKLLNTVH